MNNNKQNKNCEKPCAEVQDGKKVKKNKAKTAKVAVISTAFGLCVSAIVGLSVALHFADKSIATHETYQRQMDAVYSRAYYDLLDGASDLGINLRKIGISNSPRMQQSLLYEVWSSASLAENSFATFSSDDEGTLKAQKFVNQLGDYSHTLAQKIGNGGSLDAEDRKTLMKMGDMADAYERALRRAGDNLKDGKAFTGDDGVAGEFSGAFNEFADPNFAYPEMIYDGPFSDALEHDEVQLVGEEIDETQGKDIILNSLNGVSADSVKFMGESKGDVETLNYVFDMGGMDTYMQLAKKGGMPILLNTSGNLNEEEAARKEASDTCQQVALAFADRLGFKDLECVWSSSSHGECFVNLAPKKDGIILYADLIKVKVRERDNKVTGLDATHYAFNHKERNIPSAAISAEQAKTALSIAPIREGRLALIPLKNGREVLTYEFECEENGTYYIYIDAVSGDEANILYVIDDEMGMRTI